MSALRSPRGTVRRPASVTPERWVAWRTVLRTFAEDAYTDRAFAGECERASLDARQRALAQHLAYGTVRGAKRFDHVIGRAGHRPIARIDPPILAALRLGVVQLLEADGIPPHAAVDQSVEIVRAATGERAVPFANAVLRRVQADGATWLAELDPEDPSDQATLLSMPDWIVRRMASAHGEDGLRALAAQDEPPGVTPLRHNPLRGDRPHDLFQPPPDPWPELVPEACTVASVGADVGGLVECGLLLPQSLASMAVAHLLDPRSGERVLDMCAAPGGKTSHLAALMGGLGSIVACELHEHRADSLRAVVERAGASAMVDIRCVNATALRLDGAAATSVGTFDRILLDAPCTGLGVLGRRPDLRWRRTEEDVEPLVALQRNLLEAAVPLLRPGGRIVYSTCTLLPQENEAQMQWVVDRFGLVVEPLPQGWDALRHHHVEGAAVVWPQRHRSEGFFMCRMRAPGGSS